MPYPVDLPDPEIERGSPALQVDSLPAELPGKPITYKTWVNLTSIILKEARYKKIHTVCLHLYKIVQKQAKLTHSIILVDFGGKEWDKDEERAREGLLTVFCNLGGVSMGVFSLL